MRPLSLSQGGGTSATATEASNLTQAVLLRNNSITAIPDMSMFSACPFVDLSFNQITSVPPNAFASWSGGLNLTVYLNSNNVSTL